MKIPSAGQTHILMSSLKKVLYKFFIESKCILINSAAIFSVVLMNTTYQISFRQYKKVLLKCILQLLANYPKLAATD